MAEPTGPDYLMAMADKASDQLPFAKDFRDMVFACFSGPDPAVSPTAAIAKRPLTAEEQAPIAVVGAAFEMAFQKGDMDSVEEILKVGMSLAIKFREFLEMRV